MLLKSKPRKLGLTIRPAPKSSAYITSKTGRSKRVSALEAGGGSAPITANPRDIYSRDIAFSPQR